MLEEVVVSEEAEEVVVSDEAATTQTIVAEDDRRDEVQSEKKKEEVAEEEEEFELTFASENDESAYDDDDVLIKTDEDEHGLESPLVIEEVPKSPPRGAPAPLSLSYRPSLSNPLDVSFAVVSLLLLLYNAKRLLSPTSKQPSPPSPLNNTSVVLGGGGGDEYATSSDPDRRLENKTLEEIEHIVSERFAEVLGAGGGDGGASQVIARVGGDERNLDLLRVAARHVHRVFLNKDKDKGMDEEKDKGIQDRQEAIQEAERAIAQRLLEQVDKMLALILKQLRTDAATPKKASDLDNQLDQLQVFDNISEINSVLHPAREILEHQLFVTVGDPRKEALTKLEQVLLESNGSQIGAIMSAMELCAQYGDRLHPIYEKADAHLEELFEKEDAQILLVAEKKQEAELGALQDDFGSFRNKMMICGPGGEEGAQEQNVKLLENNISGVLPMGGGGRGAEGIVMVSSATATSTELAIGRVMETNVASNWLLEARKIRREITTDAEKKIERKRQKREEQRNEARRDADRSVENRKIQGREADLMLKLLKEQRNNFVNLDNKWAGQRKKDVQAAHVAAKTAQQKVDSIFFLAAAVLAILAFALTSSNCSVQTDVASWATNQLRALCLHLSYSNPTSSNGGKVGGGSGCSATFGSSPTTSSTCDAYAQAPPPDLAQSMFSTLTSLYSRSALNQLTGRMTGAWIWVLENAGMDFKWLSGGWIVADLGVCFVQFVLRTLVPIIVAKLFQLVGFGRYSTWMLLLGTVFCLWGPMRTALGSLGPLASALTIHAGLLLALQYFDKRLSWRFGTQTRINFRWPALLFYYALVVLVGAVLGCRLVSSQSESRGISLGHRVTSSSLFSCVLTSVRSCSIARFITD